MISDEELKAISEVDVNLIVKNYCLVFKIPQVEAEAAIGPVMRAQEMAQELLAYREAVKGSSSCRIPLFTLLRERPCPSGRGSSNNPKRTP